MPGKTGVAKKLLGDQRVLIGLCLVMLVLGGWLLVKLQRLETGASVEAIGSLRQLSLAGDALVQESTDGTTTLGVKEDIGRVGKTSPFVTPRIPPPTSMEEKSPPEMAQVQVAPVSGPERRDGGVPRESAGDGEIVTSEEKVLDGSGSATDTVGESQSAAGPETMQIGPPVEEQRLGETEVPSGEEPGLRPDMPEADGLVALPPKPSESSAAPSPSGQVKREGQTESVASVDTLTGEPGLPTSEGATIDKQTLGETEKSPEEGQNESEESESDTALITAGSRVGGAEKKGDASLSLPSGDTPPIGSSDEPTSEEAVSTKVDGAKAVSEQAASEKLPGEKPAGEQAADEIPASERDVSTQKETASVPLAKPDVEKKSEAAPELAKTEEQVAKAPEEVQRKQAPTTTKAAEKPKAQEDTAKEPSKEKDETVPARDPFQPPAKVGQEALSQKPAESDGNAFAQQQAKPKRVIFPEMRVTGIVSDGIRSMAIIEVNQESHIVAPGTPVNDIRVTTITPKNVTVEKEGQEVVLEIGDD